jgi:hypothetical protein
MVDALTSFAETIANRFNSGSLPIAPHDDGPDDPPPPPRKKR